MPRAHDPSVCGLDFRGLALALLGYPDQALESSAGAMELGREIAHPNSYGQALMFGAWIRLLRRDSAAAREMAEAAFALSKEHGLGIWIGWAKFLIGATAIADEGKEEGIAHMRDAISGMAGAKVWMPFFHSTLAEALGRVGRVDEALGLLDARGAIADNGGETWFQAEIHRLRGELILARSATDRDEAQAAFNQALQLASTQSAKLLELRAAISLARLWGENKKKAEACEILSPVYGWFTEGFDTPDLQDAKVLLDELS